MGYSFIDTVENSTAGSYLPAEAMSYDGIFLSLAILKIEQL